MWQDIIDQKDKWIGGTLTDFGDPQDRRMFPESLPARTPITDITLSPEQFNVEGEKFGCGGSRQHLGITGERRDGIDLLFTGYGGHEWGITKPAS